MKSSIKKLKSCKRVVEVKLPPEKVRDTFEEVYADIKKVASIPGFRAGRVPRDLLERHYAKTAREEVIKKLIPETYRNVIKQYKLDPIGYPDISEVRLDIEKGLSYRATIETRPEIPLKNYKGLRLKKRKVDVKEEDIHGRLESLREASAQKVPKKEGEGKEKVLPELDDEFARDLGFENLDKLKEAVRQDLQTRMERESESDLEMQIINQLVDSTNFELPESLVKAEKERLLKDANMRVAYIEALQRKQNPDKKFELTDRDRKELEEKAEKQAFRQVKAFFILDKIAQMEKIYLTQDELDNHLEEMAKQYQKTKDEIRGYLEEHKMLDEMAVNMRNIKVIKFLLKEARISN